MGIFDLEWVTNVAFDPVKYLQDVKSEAGRVRWPTRKETLVTTGMVLTMAVLAAIFLFSVDQVFASIASMFFASKR